MRKRDSPNQNVISNNTTKKGENEEHSRINQEEVEPKEVKEEEEEVEEIEEEEEEDDDEYECEYENNFTDEEFDDHLFVQTSGAMSQLPMEIFFNILSRVPIKSLTQCRKVCVAWYNSIQHPLFIKMQHAKAIESNSHLVILNEAREGKYYLLDEEDVVASFEVSEIFQMNIFPKLYLELNSCNGLLFINEPPFVICNPVTGEFIVLQKSPKYETTATASGFGFDSITEEYKVIRIVPTDKDYHETEVYTVSSGMWRTITDVPYTFEWKSPPNVFFNGALHWLGFEQRNSTKTEVIVSFKLGSEEFGELPLPPYFENPEREESFRHYLVVLNGYLCFSCHFADEPPEIWVMKNYGEQRSWTKEYVVEDVCEWGAWIPFQALKMMNNGEILATCFNEIIGSYDPKADHYNVQSFEGPA